MSDDPSPVQQQAPDAPQPGGAKRVVKLLAQVAIVGVALYYVGRVLWTNWSDLEARRGDLELWYALLAIPFGFFYVLGRGLIWHRIVIRIAGPSPRKLDVAVWLSSTLGKYIPGKVFLLLGRVYVYRKRGVPGTAITLGFLYEMAAVFATSFLFMLTVLEIPAEPQWQLLRLLAALGLVGFVVGSHPRILSRCASRIPPIRKVAGHLDSVRGSDPLTWMAMMVANWCVLGIGFYCLARAFVVVPLTAAPHLIASFAVAGISGIAVILAPSGLGVREGVLTVLLTPTLGPATAAALAIAARLWITVAEVMSALIALPYVRDNDTVPPHGEPAGGDRQ